MGQRLIFVASQLLVTSLALLPALIIGLVMFFVVNLVAGPAAGGAVAALSMAVLLASEVWVGVQWLGGRFEKLDISSELRA